MLPLMLIRAGSVFRHDAASLPPRYAAAASALMMMRRYFERYAMPILYSAMPICCCALRLRGKLIAPRVDDKAIALLMISTALAAPMLSRYAF